MDKRKLGWLINGCLVGASIITSIAFPNPAVIFPVVAGATLTGTLQSIFTIVESKDEKEKRERRTHIKQISTNEDSKNSEAPEKTYENLHTNPNQATFKGEHKTNFEKTLEQLNAPYKKNTTQEIADNQKNRISVFWNSENAYAQKHRNTTSENINNFEDEENTNEI